MSKARPIDTNFVVMNERFNAEIVPVTDELYANLDATFGAFAGHSLISCYTFKSDWPTWEVHPHGDEFVILLDGEIELVLGGDTAADDEVVRLQSPGDFVIVPRNTWHTGRVSRSAKCLFVTPGEGTENLEQPPRSGAAQGA